MLQKTFKCRLHLEVPFYGTALNSAVFAFCLFALLPAPLFGDEQVGENEQAHVIFYKDNPLSASGRKQAEALSDFASAYIKIRQDKKFSDASVKLLLDSVNKNPYAISPLKLLVAHWARLGKYDEMLKHFLPLSEKYPDAVRLNILTSDALLREQKNREAGKLLEKSMAAVRFKTSENVSADLLGELVNKLSGIYLRMDDVDAGEELWDDALDNPELAEQIIVRMSAVEFFANYADKGPDGFFAGWSKRRYREKLEKNLAVFEKIWVDSQMSNALLLAPVISVFKRYKMGDRAEKILLETLLDDPNNSSAILILATTYSDFERYNDAVRVWQTIIDSGRYSRAGVIWKFLTRNRGNEGDFYLELASVALRGGDFKEATRAFDWFLLLNPDDPEALFQLGVTYMRMYQYTNAILKFEQVVGLPEADFYRARCYVYEKRYEKALDALNDAEKKAKQHKRESFLDKNFFLEYAIVADQADEFEKAENVLKKLVRESPDDPMLNNFLGYLWAEKGINLDQAQSLIEKALAKDRKNAAYIDSMAWVFFKKKQYEYAKDNIVKALEIEGEVPDAVIADHAGDIYFALKDKDKALKYWQMALEIYSEDIDRETIKNKIDSLRESQFEKL